MDLVDWSQERYEQIKAEFRSFAMKLDVHDLTFVPVSALHGDNVVERSANMSWYEGSSLVHHLEEVHIASDRNLIDPLIVRHPPRLGQPDLHDYRAGHCRQRRVRWDEWWCCPGLTITVSAIDTGRPVDGPSFPWPSPSGW
jgi:sulfate adenylyltransferase subunit 1 (EFTu-like GTPase family)